MELADIINVLGNGFFPIICCGVMFWLFRELSDTMKDLSVTLALINQRLDNIEEIIEHENKEVQ